MYIANWLVKQYSIGVLRTLSNIYDGVFFKLETALILALFLQKNFIRHVCQGPKHGSVFPCYCYLYDYKIYNYKFDLMTVFTKKSDYHIEYFLDIS